MITWRGEGGGLTSFVKLLWSDVRFASTQASGGVHVGLPRETVDGRGTVVPDLERNMQRRRRQGVNQTGLARRMQPFTGTHLDLTFCVEEDVLGLEVPVRHSL